MRNPILFLCTLLLRGCGTTPGIANDPTPQDATAPDRSPA